MEKAHSSRDLALHIVRTLQQTGHVAYFAGGCVRDQIMGHAPKDYDVATAARPDQVLKLFPHSQKVGVAFGVVLVKSQGWQVEVATFRSDGVYADGRHPESVHFTTPEHDAQRRDFTCNGLFLNPMNGEVHDFVGGGQDILTKTLRAIGDPHARFAEDHLRMLRAVRFAARLDFAIEPLTRQAIADLQTRIELISRERIGEEIRMMLEHPTRALAVELLAGFQGLFTEVFGLAPSPEASRRRWPVLSGLPEQTSRTVSLVALLLDNACPDLRAAGHTLRTRLMLSNDESGEILWLSEKLPALEKWENLTKAAFKRMMADPRWGHLESLYHADPENADQLLAFGERTASLMDDGVAPPPLCTGETLISLGVAPGPKFKRWLEILYDRQLEGELQTPEQALAAARELITRPPPAA